jgi:hypothetical protein
VAWGGAAFGHCGRKQRGGACSGLMAPEGRRLQQHSKDPRESRAPLSMVVGTARPQCSPHCRATECSAHLFHGAQDLALHLQRVAARLPLSPRLIRRWRDTGRRQQAEEHGLRGTAAGARGGGGGGGGGAGVCGAGRRDWGALLKTAAASTAASRAPDACASAAAYAPGAACEQRCWRARANANAAAAAPAGPHIAGAPRGAPPPPPAHLHTVVQERAVRDHQVNQRLQQRGAHAARHEP